MDTQQFIWQNLRLEYSEYGSGSKWVVLIHGQFVPRLMHHKLAQTIANAGYHVLTLDLLGHGGSDRPVDPSLYSIPDFAAQVIGLLDHLEIKQACIAGTSLGANVSLEVATRYPLRTKALILEMPVLDNALTAGIVAFAPLLFAARYAPLLVSATKFVTGLVPRAILPFWGKVAQSTLQQEPQAFAATLHGIFFGEIAPPTQLREKISCPTLIIGHPHDPVHPAADAAMLADEIRQSQFIKAHSILEWRATPNRLNHSCINFLNQVYQSKKTGKTAVS